MSSSVDTAFTVLHRRHCVSFQGLKCVALALCMMLMSGRAGQFAGAAAASLFESRATMSATASGHPGSEDSSGPASAPSEELTDTDDADDDDDGDGVCNGVLIAPVAIAPAPYVRTHFVSTEEIYRGPD